MRNVVGTLACIFFVSNRDWRRRFIYCLNQAKIKIGMSLTIIHQVGCDKVVPVDKLPRKVHVMGNAVIDDCCNWG